MKTRLLKSKDIAIYVGETGKAKSNSIQSIVDILNSKQGNCGIQFLGEPVEYTFNEISKTH